MIALLKFEWRNYFRKPAFYIFLLLPLLFGLLAGSNFSLSMGPDVFKNGAYTIAAMVGLMSLLSIFFTTVFTTQILFREKDSNFNLILFATPMRKQDYLLSRFTAVFSISTFCFVLFVTGFALGQTMPADRSPYTAFHFMYYLQPFILFGLINTFFCSAIVCTVAWLSKNKLMVYVTGLFIYILYMVTLIFSGSPMMAQSMPQSAGALQLSAIFDPFGLSAFFMQTGSWSVAQRNSSPMPLTGTLLLNRIAVVIAAVLSLLVSFKTFSFRVNEKRSKTKAASTTGTKFIYSDKTLRTIRPSQHWSTQLAVLASFTRLDLKYIIKSIPFVLACIGLLFHHSMEMYGMIEKGIRIPQQYASSGLMAGTIIDNFHGLGLIVILYYANEICWRSRNSNFHLIENATPAGNAALFFSKWLTLCIVIIFFTSLMIALGIAFQLLYHYPRIDLNAYAGVYLFTAWPLMVSAGIILVIQKLIRYKYVGLVVSAAVIVLTATSVGTKIMSYPLLTFQVAYKGLYSDMNGYGPYAASFGWQYLFGSCVVVIFALLLTLFVRKRIKPVATFTLAILLVCACVTAMYLLKDHKPVDRETALSARAAYEKNYRVFQDLPQPTVTDIVTAIDLFPAKDAYEVSATYTIRNKTNKPISRILVNFHDDVAIGQAILVHGKERINVQQQYTVINLAAPLQPNATAQFSFRFAYHWAAVNGHQPFNAIIKNGSFMRISRYYPVFGYIPENEIDGKHDRDKFNLGQATAFTSADAPKNAVDDFINLNMTISTEAAQTAIAVGELVKQWKQDNRNYFQYQTSSPVPFRFAVSSAAYAVQTAFYKGKKIEVYYHPTHAENVAHLIKNAQLTLDYCQTNFGAYPFATIRFAEVSAFTKGFAATAYPATIFMTERMIFNANLGADKKQDVINELAGHELSHLWWGNNQVSPDERAGNTLLTETLAMYTELMLVKKMYGHERVLDNVNLHLGIYLDERGFSKEQPLYNMLPDNTHLCYSKGMVVMYQLQEMIGEAKINQALKQFLQKHAYPHSKPIPADLINELYAVTDSLLHTKIDDLFKKITLCDFEVRLAAVSKTGAQYSLAIEADGEKFYEDGNGRRTKVPFTDSVEIAIVFENGLQKIVKLPVINNNISAKLMLNDMPASILIDPDVRFIKLRNGKQYSFPVKPL